MVLVVVGEEDKLVVCLPLFREFDASTKAFRRSDERAMIVIRAPRASGLVIVISL